VNPDGTPNVEHLRYASTLRLKARWDDIFERFRDAHLIDQDEIDLGRPGPEDKGPRLVRDRGLLRALPQKRLDFGCFIKEEDLVFEGETLGDPSALAMGAEEAEAARSDEEESDDEEGGGRAVDKQLLSQYPEFQRGPSAPWQSVPLYEPAQLGNNDDDLRDFLDAEARRRTLRGDDSADEGDVVDFDDPQWQRDGAPPRRPRAGSQDGDAAEGALGYSSSEEMCEVIMTPAELDEFYREELIARRENVEDDFFLTRINTILPYDDVPGLAELLDLPPPRRKRGRPRKHALLPDDFSSAAKRGKKSVCGGPVMIRVDSLTGLPTPPRSGPEESCGDTSTSPAHPAVAADTSGSVSVSGQEQPAPVLQPKARPRKSVAKPRVAGPDDTLDEGAVADLDLQRELLGASPRKAPKAKRVRKPGSSSKRKATGAAQEGAGGEGDAAASTSLDGAEPAALRPKKRSRPRRSDAEFDPNAPPKRRPGRPKGSKDKKPRRLAPPRPKKRAEGETAPPAGEEAPATGDAAPSAGDAAPAADETAPPAGEDAAPPARKKKGAVKAAKLSSRKSATPAVDAASSAPAAPTTTPRNASPCGGEGGCNKTFCLKCGNTFSSPLAAMP
jgi:hypothetical protein